MKKAHRYFTLEEIGYTQEQIVLIFNQLEQPTPYAWYDMTIIWSTDDVGNRYVFVQVGDHDIGLQVQHTTLLQSMEDFKKAIRGKDGEELPVKEVMNKLALFDVQRALKNPLVAYYQGKIADLARF